MCEPEAQVYIQNIQRDCMACQQVRQEQTDSPSGCVYRCIMYTAKEPIHTSLCWWSQFPVGCSPLCPVAHLCTPPPCTAHDLTMHSPASPPAQGSDNSSQNVFFLFFFVVVPESQNKFPLLFNGQFVWNEITVGTYTFTFKCIKNLWV